MPLPTVESFTGGDVAGILIGAALRLKAMTTAAPIEQAGTGAQTFSNHAWLGYAGIPIHTRKQEAYSMDAEVVQHTLEGGAKMSDHVILHPLRIGLQFEVSNWNRDETKYIAELLKQTWRARTPVDLLTEHEILPLMVMSNLKIVNSVPEWGKLDCSASFTQVSFGGVEITTYIAEKVTGVPEVTSGPDASKSAVESTDNGKVEVIDPRSYAKQAGGEIQKLFEGLLQ